MRDDGTMLAARGGPARSERSAWATERLSVLRQLSERTPATALTVSAALLDEVRSMARRGDPAVDVVDGVRRLHLSVQDAILSATMPQKCQFGALSGPTRDDLRRLADYSESATRTLLETFEVERSIWGNELLGRRTELLSRVAAGGVLTPDDERAAAGQLDGQHLVVLVAGSPESTGSSALLRDAASLAGSSPVVTTAEGALVWWWSGSTVPEPESFRGLRPGTGIGVAVGSTHLGPGGLARSLADARRALNVAATGGQVVLAEDVLIPGALLADRAVARQLVDRQLSGVLGLDPRCADLRRTVLAHLRTGGSRQAVAAELRIAPTTVAYRIERFEQLRGRPLRDSRLETWVALDLVDRAPSLLNAECDGHGRAALTDSAG